MSIEIFNPSSPELLQARNYLLQSTMRPENPVCDIASEYPIVLSPEHHSFSWCMIEGETILAHLNLWPRTLFHNANQQSYEIGLIGNVATEPSWQGKGLMRTLIQHATQIAQNMNLTALVLWSDLIKFYQKLGFESVSREFRISLAPESLRRYFSRRFLPRDPSEFSDSDIKLLMNLRRQPKATLLRSPEEFRKLLTIPFTHIFTADDLNQGYGIVGKGYDMAGVIHEWGLPNDNLILPLCADVVFGLNFPQIMLLSPQLPEADSFKDLSTSEIVIESHPMALALYISRSDDVKKALQTSFIWGLDSI